ncbi:MAG: aspartate/glutamate racemase family protein [Thermoanaerobaculales bacterium]|jgi:aspartate racemase|nr:aspartate/glutamate racemase family protein [Thermoanaerobaculales bacterium]
MKTIGLLGGMTCESSVEYYRLINEGARRQLGGIHSAQSLMYSVDFGEIQPEMEAERWDLVLERLVAGSLAVQRGGADFLVICTNTMHKLADQVAESIEIPLLNIIDVTAEAIAAREIGTVGLLGTRFTMTQDFYRRRLLEQHGIETLIPSADEVSMIHDVIMDELTIGVISPTSKQRYWETIHRLRAQGAEGIILGCTEIPLLVKQDEGEIPLFDTTLLHAQAAVRTALE